MRRAAADVGVNHNALGKFLKGETPYDGTLDTYEGWIRRRRKERRAVAEAAGETYSLANQIIFEVTGLTESDKDEQVLEAYRRAFKRGRERAVLAEIDGWRNTYLQLPLDEPGEQPV